MNWTTVEFETLYAEPSKNGLTRPARVRGSGYRMINMGELFANNRIGDIPMELVPMNDREFSKMLVEPGDLLFARQSLILAGAGKCSIVQEASEPTTFESHIIRVRLKRGIADPRFFFYYFRSPRCGIRSIVIHGVQAGIRGNDLKRLLVHFPPIEAQARIASVLSAYDDLIENNRRRIQLLEHAARLLYKEWFVHLGYPGHEHVKVLAGIPEGWERRPLTGCASFLSGGTPSKKRTEFWEGDIPWVSSGELKKMRVHRTSLNITQEAVAAGSRLVPKNTILMVVRGMSLAKELRMGITARPVAFNQDIKALSAMRDVDALFLFQAIDSQRELIRERTGEASHGTKKLDTPVLSSVSILVPPETIQALFSESVAPLHAQWDVLDQQNQQLSQARNLLLPRLMNGEVAV